jgi:hypothetical protein
MVSTCFRLESALATGTGSAIGSNPMTECRTLPDEFAFGGLCVVPNVLPFALN